MATSISKELDRELIEKLSAVIRNKKNTSANLSVLKEFPSWTWCSMCTEMGHNLLQSSIMHNNKEAFHFLLPFYDIVCLERQDWKNDTALLFALKICSYNIQVGEYYALELIKSGVFIYTYLHMAVGSKSSKVVALLLEKGVDVNVQNEEGNTALHTVLMCNVDVNVDEMVAVLMYYNADPLIENNEGYIPFEYAIRDDRYVSLQEILFLYTFGEHTSCKINIGTVIHMAKSKSPLLHEMFKYNLEFKYNPTFENNLTLTYKKKRKKRNKYNIRCFFFPAVTCFAENFDSFNSLLNMDTDTLEIIVRNCSFALKKIISLTKFPYPDFRQLHQFAFGPLTSVKGINNLDILLEGKTKPNVISLLRTLQSSDVFRTVILNNSEEVATEVLTYLLSYGLHFEEIDYHIVYKSFGYCNLFKLLLHVGVKVPCTRTDSIIPRIIYDIYLDHERIFETEPICESSVELLDYFAHPKLADYVMKCKNRGMFSEETIARIESHPNIPRLEELGRNVFRKYLIEKFQIDSTSLFYSFVNWLSISNIHKKIITYEAKLYR